MERQHAKEHRRSTEAPLHCTFTTHAGIDLTFRRCGASPCDQVPPPIFTIILLTSGVTDLVYSAEWTDNHRKN